jgi:UDP-glucose:(heptosyl)LPS alpha-1,3-glucosyltransferase
MRIAFIVHEYCRTRGHARYVLELATRFAREHEVHVFAAEILGERDPRIQFHYVPSLRFSKLAAVLTFILPGTLRLFSSFDIVHAQGLCGLRQNVVTAHSCYPAWFTAHEQHMGGLTLAQKIFRALVTPLENYVFQAKHSAAVIAVSKHVKADIGTYYGRVDDVSVVYHGVNLAVFHPDNRLRWRAIVRLELGIGNDKFVALYIGDLQKGGIPAIEAIARVDGARLICVSDSNSEPYRLFAEKMDAGDRVHFVSKTDCIERYYSAADIFVMPSFYDTFGMVVSEAMACGLPTIVSVDTGASELIEHGVSGVVINPAWNVNSVVEWIEHLKDDVDFREKMSNEARRKMEHFTWDDTAIETMRVYKDVVAKKKL